MELPNWQSYGNYASENYGSHALVFSVGDLDVYFSYKTPVAFRYPGIGLVIRWNDWGPTTGKHLNTIDPDKTRRVSGEAFELALSNVLKSMEGAQA